LSDHFFYSTFLMLLYYQFLLPVPSLLPFPSLLPVPSLLPLPDLLPLLVKRIGMGSRAIEDSFVTVVSMCRLETATTFGGELPADSLRDTSDNIALRSLNSFAFFSASKFFPEFTMLCTLAGSIVSKRLINVPEITTGVFFGLYDEALVSRLVGCTNEATG